MCGRRRVTELRYIRVLMYYDKQKRHVFFVTYMAQLHLDFQFKCSSMELFDHMKAKIKPAVKSSYEFDTRQTLQSTNYNAGRAQLLLSETTFIYQVYLLVSHL